MLVGGIAVGHYGYPRATGDIDLWVDNSPENGIAMSRVFTEFGLNLPNDFPEIFCIHGKVFRLGHPPLRIEVLTGISGVRFDECYPRRGTVRFDDIDVDVISIDDLKTNKRASGRTNDIDDLAHLP